MDCSSLWPSKPDQSLFLWGAIAGKLGCKYPLERPFLIGVRGVKLFGLEPHPTRSVAEYDDAFVLLPPGKRQVFFPGATHAMQRHSSASPDVDGDGQGDVATIDTGRYLLIWKTDDRAGCPIFELTTHDGLKAISCHRDLDHDGIAESPGYKATAVLMHTGPFDSPPSAEHKSSIACQVTGLTNLLAMRAAGKVLDYVLTTAENLVTLVSELPSWDDVTEPQA